MVTTASTVQSVEATDDVLISTLKVLIATRLEAGPPATTQEIAEETGAPVEVVRAAYASLAEDMGEDPMLARIRRGIQRLKAIDLSGAR